MSHKVNLLNHNLRLDWPGREEFFCLPGLIYESLYWATKTWLFSLFYDLWLL